MCFDNKVVAFIDVYALHSLGIIPRLTHFHTTRQNMNIHEEWIIRQVLTGKEIIRAILKVVEYYELLYELF